MARETKVGLLAGLAFIVCFAVILANRGRQGSITPHLFQLADAGATARHATGTQPDDQPVSSSQRNNHTRPAMEPTNAPRDVPAGARGVQGWMDVDDAAEAAPEYARDVPRRPPLVPSAGLTGADQGNASVGQATTTQQGRRNAGDVAAIQRRLDELSEQLALRGQTERTAERAGKAAPSPTPPPPTVEPVRRSVPVTPLARYTVQAGDTLTRIANTYYGSKSHVVINAIFDANRASLASPDQVSVGLELLLPTIEGVGDPSGAGRARASNSIRPVGEPPRRDEPLEQRYRWYQIRKNDRYVSIARTELGDESRWHEIHELNKDKFPDPGRIREGVRIRLPIVRVVDSGERQP